MQDRVQESVVLKVLYAIRCPLFQSAASLDRQLAALRQRCGGGGSNGAGSNLPTAAQLQAAWAALVIKLIAFGMGQGLPLADLAAFREQAARDLLALQPDNPRTSYELGVVATGSASCLRDPLVYFWRGAKLAREQGSDFWLARWAGVGVSCKPYAGLEW